MWYVLSVEASGRLRMWFMTKTIIMHRVVFLFHICFVGPVPTARPGVAPLPTRDLFQGLGKGKTETSFVHAKAGNLEAVAEAGAAAAAAVAVAVAVRAAVADTGLFFLSFGCEMGATNSTSNVTIATAIAPVVVAARSRGICFANPTAFAYTRGATTRLVRTNSSINPNKTPMNIINKTVSIIAKNCCRPYFLRLSRFCCFLRYFIILVG